MQKDKVIHQLTIFRDKKIISGTFTQNFDSLDFSLLPLSPKNKAKLENYFATPSRNFLLPEQIHSTKVAVYKEKASLPEENLIDGVDGVITDKKNTLLIVRHADCVPIFLFDMQKKVIGLIHSGWRGTVGKIGLVALAKMINQFGCYPKNILVGLGPSAQACCYKVDVFPFLDLPEWRNFIKKRGQSLFINLSGLIEQMFLEAGILKKNLEVAKICTICDKRFFSWTRQRQNREKKKMGWSILAIK